MFTRMIRTLQTLAVEATAILAASQASANVLYGSAFFNSLSRSQLYTMDTGTGRATIVGGNTVAFFPGLAFSPTGSLFGSGSTLWSVSQGTGNATAIGILPELVVSIAFNPAGQLWGIGNGTGTLWQLYPATGQSVTAGFLTGLQSGGIRSIAFNSQGTLFGIGQGVLYDVNTQTFAATAIAALTPCCTVSGLAFGPNGELFTSQGVSLFGTSTLSTIQIASGDLSPIGAATITPPALFVEGLAFSVTPVPEVGTGALLAAGLLVIGIYSRRIRADA